MDWTEEATTILHDMWTAGHSSGDIAHVLNATRNAVMGRVSRLGLKRSADAEAKKAKVLASRSRDYARRKVAATLVKLTVPPGAKTKPETRSDALPLTDAVTRLQAKTAKALLDLGRNECRWPVAALFCGEPTAAGKTFCACHQAVAYEPTRIVRAHAPKLLRAWR